MSHALVWLRKDLRLSHNEALQHAYRNKQSVLFVYILDTTDPHKIGSASQWFLYQALDSFQQEVKKKYGAKLLIEKGEPQKKLGEIVRKYKINCLLWNQVFEPYALRRDQKIKDFFEKKNMEVKSFNSSLLFDPHQIKNGAGSYFKVFTPFWNQCKKQLHQVDSNPPKAAPSSLLLIPPKGKGIEEGMGLKELNLLPQKKNWAKNWSTIYTVSEKEAQSLLKKFIKNKARDYEEKRDFPNSPGTSRLSPYLQFGLISSKQIYFASRSLLGDKGVNCFVKEVGWREFSYHLLFHFPQLPKKNFKPSFDSFTWENKIKNLKKWQKGNTGIPLVDAGMRELWHTGWMHNRVRMVVASFLIKNLLIDWRKGQDWFWDCLVDADLASNSASWQWVAGSGADASPYFRIFNPITQSKKFDPQGEYIKKWVPELAHLSAPEIHNPKDRRGYPEPIIDLKSSRERALGIYMEKVKK